jgi:glutamate--cysteine ligase
MSNNPSITTKEQLESFAAQNWTEINSFIDKQSKGLPVPFYSSVDIREGKSKFAPVDQNMYPAGFNNLCMFDLNITSDKLNALIEAAQPQSKTIGILTESHTKNLFYLDHLATLKHTLEKAGFEVFCLSFDTQLFEGEQKLSLVSQSEYPIEIYQAYLDNHKISLRLEPEVSKALDFVILNNDQSQPIDIDWKQVKTQVEPSPFIGWFQRQKIKHFTYYHKVLHDFCQHFSIDPNLMEANYLAVENVDFSTKEGLDRLASTVDQLKENIPQDAPIFVKASQGTYGMGIQVVHSGEEILSLNRKKRNKLDIGKNKIKFTSVLVQEGVETIIKYDDTPAEVTIYLVGGVSVGGFMRANPLKSAKENLNSRGMVYQKFCISEIRDNNDHKAKEALYSTIARLSTLAGAYEIQEILHHKEGSHETV